MPDTPTKAVVDCATGAVELVPLTEEEIAFRETLAVELAGPTAEQLATLAAVLLAHADDLNAAVAAVAGSNTAKPALEIVDAAVQAAATT